MPDVRMPHLKARCLSCVSLRVLGIVRGISLCLCLGVDRGLRLMRETRVRREAEVEHARLTRLRISEDVLRTGYKTDESNRNMGVYDWSITKISL